MPAALLFMYLFCLCFCDACATPTPAIIVSYDREQYMKKERHLLSNLSCLTFFFFF